MSTQASVAELIDNAARLDKREFENFFKKMGRLCFGLLTLLGCIENTTSQRSNEPSKTDEAVIEFFDQIYVSLSLKKHTTLVYDDFLEKYVPPGGKFKFTKCDRLLIVERGILRFKDKEQGMLAEVDLKKHPDYYYRYPNFNIVTLEYGRFQINFRDRTLTHFNSQYERHNGRFVHKEGILYTDFIGNLQVRGLTQEFE